MLQNLWVVSHQSDSQVQKKSRVECMASASNTVTMMMNVFVGVRGALSPTVDQSLNPRNQYLFRCNGFSGAFLLEQGIQRGGRPLCKGSDHHLCSFLSLHLLLAWIPSMHYAFPWGGVGMAIPPRLPARAGKSSCCGDHRPPSRRLLIPLCYPHLYVDDILPRGGYCVWSSPPKALALPRLAFVQPP